MLKRCRPDLQVGRCAARSRTRAELSTTDPRPAGRRSCRAGIGRAASCRPRVGTEMDRGQSPYAVGPAAANAAPRSPQQLNELALALVHARLGCALARVTG